MSKWKPLAAAILLLVACRKEASSSSAKTGKVTTTTIPSDAARAQVRALLPVDGTHFVDKMLLGTKVKADGTVAEEATSFAAGQPVYLTLWILQSPAGLRTSAKWLDPDGKEISAEQHDMNRQKVTTFELKETKKLAPGKYKVEAYWGGNLADSREFVVTSAKNEK